MPAYHSLLDMNMVYLFVCLLLVHSCLHNLNFTPLVLIVGICLAPAVVGARAHVEDKTLDV